jgi:4,5-dihydroxyphthalate decarboxylase
VQWVTFEEPHVAQYVDPCWVTRAAPDRQLLPMLMDGAIDAAIFGNELPDAPVRPLIPDPAAAAHAWSARHHAQPINHMAVVRQSIARQQPEVVREVYRLLLESHASAAANAAGSAIRFGIEANRRSLELIIEYALRQQLIPRPVSVDELFDEAVRVLGTS